VCQNFKKNNTQEFINILRKVSKWKL
jgi:hypothetical protein